MQDRLKLFGLVILMLTTVAFMSSCQKNEKKIVGKWKITKAPQDYSNDKGEIWTFKESGNCSIFYDEEELDGEYSVNKNSLSITCKDGDYRCNFDFDIDVLNKKEMSLSGTVKESTGYYNYSGKVSYDFEKR